MKASSPKRRPARVPTPAQIQKTLREVFGFKKLRDSQAEVIDAVLKGDPVLAVMPTGAGKSLCYQLPGTFRKGTTVVISPLIALMRDQREKMDDFAITASELNSTLSVSEQRDVMNELKTETDVLYTTPERLTNPEFLKALSHIDIGLFVIDEVHCLSQWGHDFRPAYLAVAEAWKILGQPQLLALTATATTDVVDELKELFGLPKLKIIHSGVFRKNLFYDVVHVEDEAQKITEVIKRIRETEGSGIIYSATVKAVEQIHFALTDAGLDAVKYHGRMPVKDRHASQTAFMTGETPVIVATNAFGMGIDKADIRYVIHYHFDGSLEAYYQESGRAGRDGKDALCTLLYLKRDKSTQSFFLAGKYPKPDDTAAVYQVLMGQTSLSAAKVEATLPTISKSKVKVILSALEHAGISERLARGAYRIAKKAAPKQLETVFADYQAKKIKDQEKLKSMIVYAQSSMCRWKIILNYFGQSAKWSKCGHCDNCLGHHHTSVTAGSGLGPAAHQTSIVDPTMPGVQSLQLAEA